MAPSKKRPNSIWLWNRGGAEAIYGLAMSGQMPFS